MKKVLLAVDLDDTLCDTQTEVVLRLRERLYGRADWEELARVYEYYHLNQESGQFSTMLYPQHLRNLITNEVIKPGHYVRTVKPTALKDELTHAISFLRASLGESFTAVVATHRSQEQNVRQGTAEWLMAHDAELLFDELHFIDSQAHANKIAYLKHRFPEHEILLLDDNPFGDPRTIHPHDPAVLVYDKLCNYLGYQHQNRFTTTSSLIKQIFGLSGTEFADVG